MSLYLPHDAQSLENNDTIGDNEQIASPTSDHFATSDASDNDDDDGDPHTANDANTDFETNGELEKDYDFGSASSHSNRESDEDSWETVSEEMRAEAREHQSEGQCLCTTCTMKSLSISSRLQGRSTCTTETLPENVTKVVTDDGAKIYVVGTAHFSQASQDDVVKVIQCLSPDVVMVELCPSRVGVLKYDEESLLLAAQDVSLTKLRVAIKESGSVISGVMQLLLLSMSAHITKQLGMAPGGEFRVAAKQARLICGCRLVLGDRPIQATLGRAMGSLSIFQKLKLGWHLLFSKDEITKEDVEKYKQKDMIAEMLAEMTGDFPELSRVFVQERDQYMAQMLLHCIDIVRKDLPSVIQLNGAGGNRNGEGRRGSANLSEDMLNISDAMESEQHPGGEGESEFRTDGDTLIHGDGDVVPVVGKDEEISHLDYEPVLVAVVGIGHMKGIIENMGKTCDLNELNRVPPATYSSRVFTMAVKAALVAALSWGVYSVIRWARS